MITPAKETIDIWSVFSADLRADLQTTDTLLSPAEKARAARFKFPRDRKMFLSAHNVLRIILGAYTDTSPEEVIFAMSAHKKPFLPVATLQFNLSHSGEHILIGVSSHADIGVDTEQIKPDTDLSIAARYFTAEENHLLQTLPAPLQREMFFKLWVGKEAIIKMRGTGLAGSLSAFSLDPRKDQQSVSSSAGWTGELAYVAFSADYASAVALSASFTRIRFGYLCNESDPQIHSVQDNKPIPPVLGGKTGLSTGPTK